MAWGSIIGGLFQFFAKLIGPLFAWKAGRDGARADQAEDALDKGRERNEVDDEVARMSDDDLDDEFMRDSRR